MCPFLAQFIVTAILNWYFIFQIHFWRTRCKSGKGSKQNESLHIQTLKLIVQLKVSICFRLHHFLVRSSSIGEKKIEVVSQKIEVVSHLKKNVGRLTYFV